MVYQVIGPVMYAYKIVLQSDYFEWDKTEVIVVAEDVARACMLMLREIGRHIEGVKLIGKVDAMQEIKKDEEPQYTTTWATVDKDGHVETGSGQNPNAPYIINNSVVIP